MPYSYPPSKEMLLHGELQEESHYYAEGVAFFNSKRLPRMRCTFEVGYTKECNIVVLCYPKTQQVIGLPNEFASCRKFLGRDFRTGMRVLVDGLSQISYHRRTGERISEIIGYDALLLRVWRPHEEGLSDNAEYVRYFNIAGIDIPNFLDPNHIEWDPKIRSIIMFPVSEDREKDMVLVVERGRDRREYGNQATARLIVPPSCIPKGWNSEYVADLWCALMSLAQGRDIQWTSRVVPSNEAHKFGEPREIVWKPRKIKGTEPFTPLLIRFIMKDNTDLQTYIQKAFMNSVEHHIQSEEVITYTRIVRDYVEYRLIGTKDLKGAIRLVTSLTEQLLFHWQRIHASKLPETETNLLTTAERKKLATLIRQTLEQVEDTDEDYLSENKAKREQIVERVEYLIREQINNTKFRDGMETFFKTYGYKNETLSNRIKAFLATRNSITHRGELSWHDSQVVQSKLARLSINPGRGWEEECDNALMMIPLMIFCGLGYAGKYYDLLDPRQESNWFPDVSGTDNL